jgi:hypothetical protein
MDSFSWVDRSHTPSGRSNHGEVILVEQRHAAHDPTVRTVGMVVAAGVVLLIVIALGVARALPGIGGQPSAEASPTTQPSPTVNSSEPAPTLAPVESRRPGEPITATNEQDGIRVTLALDRDRVAYGERVWAEVTVANTGTDNLYWGHSGTCPFVAEVAVNATVPTDLGYGRDDWTGELEILKFITVATEAASVSAGEAVAGFTPEPWVEVAGNMGCTSDLVTDVVAPGAQLTYRYAWDADAPHELPMQPGAYEAEATFYYMGRGASPELEPPDFKPVSVSAPLTVDTPPVDYLGPGEAVDRVLEDPGFLEMLEEAPRIGRWTGATLHFNEGRWVMMLFLENPVEAIVATVDASTGQVLEVVIDPDPGEMEF